MTEPKSHAPQSADGPDWEGIRAEYEALAGAALDAENVGAWLGAWSVLEDRLQEEANAAYLAFPRDTADRDKALLQRRWFGDIWPRAEEQRVRLSGRLLALGIVPPGFAPTIRRWHNRNALFRAENRPQLVEIEALDARYERLTGAITVSWAGEEQTRAPLTPYLSDPHRETREAAFRARARPFIGRREELAALFSRQWTARQTIAQRGDFANFREYAHRAKQRFDYSPDDCLRFHAAIEEVAVPALARRRERRRQLLGLPALRP